MRVVRKPELCSSHQRALFQEDGWDTEPFVLTEVDGKLYGRGSTDDKVGLLHTSLCSVPVVSQLLTACSLDLR